MVKIYTTNWCPSCNAAKNLLDSIDVAYTEINIEEENFSRAQLEELTGGYTVPLIIIHDMKNFFICIKIINYRIY